VLASRTGALDLKAANLRNWAKYWEGWRHPPGQSQLLGTQARASDCAASGGLGDYMDLCDARRRLGLAAPHAGGKMPSSITARRSVVVHRYRPPGHQEAFA
jgi:hypothetical protein